jgi:hypothetical protein
METPSQPIENTQIGPNRATTSINKNYLIGILIFLLILSFLGINLLASVGGFIESITSLFGPVVQKFLSLIGFTAGTVIDKTADVVTDTAKVGIDLAGGAVHDVGDLLINASKDNLDKAINSPPSSQKKTDPEPDKTENPIQNPPSSAKKSWCLVGEYQGRRGCIEIADQDKCISGQVFPEQKMCLNPNLSP